MRVKITWQCDNTESPFNIYRSSVYINEQNLPVPIAFGLDTLEYIDENGGEFYYLVGSVFNGKLYLSNQVKAIETRPGHFIVDVNFNYTPPINSVSFTVKSN